MNFVFSKFFFHNVQLKLTHEYMSEFQFFLTHYEKVLESN